MPLRISSRVLEKLLGKVPPVTRQEVEQCFMNRWPGEPLTDKRDQHKTEPRTQWFIAETDKGRRLKIVHVQEGDVIDLKTAYDPNKTELLIFFKHGAQSD